MNSRQPKNLALLFAAFILVSGCRFRQPTTAEQDELIRIGAFPSAVPTWVGRGNPAAAVRAGAGGGGLIPTQFGSSAAPVAAREEVSAEIKVEAERIERERAAASAREAEEREVAEASPIDRIVKNCPVREELVKDALLETNRAERLGKLRALTGICPESYDLWLWLGKDHQRAGEVTDASYALERAVALAPAGSAESTEAASLLVRTRNESLQP